MKIRLTSWNVNGIRAAIKKGFWGLVAGIQTDVIAIQETKTDTEKMHGLFNDANFAQIHSDDNDGLFEDEVRSIESTPGLYTLWHSATMRKGYSGVATFWPQGKIHDGARILVQNYQIGLGMEKFDVEGRVVLTQFSYQDKPLFTLINAYYPQGGRGPHRIEYKIEFYKAMKDLSQKLQNNGQKVILCGDFNTTVGDIDLARPKQNRKTTGCLPEEREALDWFIKDGFIDSFRYYYPDTPDKYSYWDQITRARERNVGWRIDYFLVDQQLEQNMKGAEILDQIMGSDHCPVTLDLEF
jgi:exodeoxyribonuclease-3